jgi:effector-binding domain-containing protein
MFKKSIFVLLILMLVMPAGSSFARSGQPLDIVFNGKKMVFTGPQPFLEGKTVLVPIRPIAEELGADLQWDAAKGKLTVKTFAWTAILGMGSKQMKINEKTVAMTSPPRVVKSAAVVPLAALEAIGMTVSWSKSRNTVSLEPEFTVVKKYVLPVLVASVRYRGQYEEIADTYTALDKQVKGVKNGKGFSMYYEQNYKLGHDTEVCIPVREAVKDTFIEHKGTTIPVKTRMLEGGYFLSVVHQGTPDTLAKVWAQMEAYAATTNATILTPSREVYLHEDVKDYRKQVTEILLYIDNK